MPRYSLRTLLILLAVGPPLMAVCFWAWSEYRASQRLEVEFSFRQSDLFAPLKPGNREVLIDNQTVQP